MAIAVKGLESCRCCLMLHTRASFDGLARSVALQRAKL